MATVKLTYIDENGTEHALEDLNITLEDIEKYGLYRILMKSTEFMSENMVKLLEGEA